MTYIVNPVENRRDIENAVSVNVDKFQWNSKEFPRTTAKMGSSTEGLVVEMICYEENPKTKFFSHLDPVYRDSAMETFFAFVPQNTETPRQEDFYINIEFNSSGAVYAGYGYGRQNRGKFSLEEILLLDLKIIKEKNYWKGAFILPFFLIKQFYKEEYDLWINFYKISESPENQHYGSFSKIHSKTPNFHRSDCFVRAEIG